MRRKVFISGLNYNTDEITIEGYFSKFGEIEDILVNKDKMTGKRKGFAFVLFKKEESASYIFNQMPQHFIDGRMVTCKVCISKNSKPQDQSFTKFKTQEIQPWAPSHFECQRF